MNKFKTKELRLKTKEELEKTLQEEKNKLRDLNFKLAGAQIKNVREIRFTKRNIAILLTILKENK